MLSHLAIPLKKKKHPFSWSPWGKPPHQQVRVQFPFDFLNAIWSLSIRFFPCPESLPHALGRAAIFAFMIFSGLIAYLCLARTQEKYCHH